MTITKPQPLRGFNDWFAPDVKLRKIVISTFEKVFEKYGYEPLETPVLEYTKNMLNISGSEAEKQFYRFKDPGGRDVMLRYEVMIGMCRAVATNFDNITFPYKRYQIQPVWRAENTQKGRYRQFTQCDADTIGSSSMTTDAEFIQMGLDITQKLGFKNFVARISNRKVLDGLREYLDVPPDKFYGMCMSIDKLTKIGLEKVRDELITRREISTSQTDQILTIITNKQYQGLDNNQILERLSPTVGQTKIGQEGLAELKEIFDYLQTCQVPEELYRFDTSLARGLASYTGPVWELEVIDGSVGSIAGCGRYDNVIGSYLGQKQSVPATGGSFGIERICDIIRDRKMLTIDPKPAQVLVTIFSPETQAQSIALANQLRSVDTSTLLYPDPDVKLGKQFKYANDKGIPYTIVIGPDEISQNLVTLKNMVSGEQNTAPIEDLINRLKQ